MDIKSFFSWRILIIVILALVVGGIFLWRSEYVQNCIANRDRMKQIQTQMAEANPKLLENLKTANKELESELRKVPTDSGSWYELGANKKHLGDYLGAEKAFKKAVELNKESILSLDSLGVIYEELGQYEKAEEMYGQIVQRQPLYEEGYLRLAELYGYGKYKTPDLAEKILLEGLKLDDKNKPMLLSLAEYYDRTGNKTKADEAWAKLKTLGVQETQTKTPSVISE